MTSSRVKTPLLRAVIFDCDGTLVDSEPAYLEADKAFLAPYGVFLSPADEERYVGAGNLEMAVDVKRRFALLPSVEELLAQKNAAFMAIARERVTPYAEVIEVVRTLRARGVPLAVASGSSPSVLAFLLERFALVKLFDVIVSSAEVTRGKPSPEIFLETARRLRVAPRECLVFEDSLYGVQAAHRAEMRCVAIPSLAVRPLPRDFYDAERLYEGGMKDFTAEELLRWLTPQLGF